MLYRSPAEDGPRVSVVIPTFHRPAMVVEAARTALGQSLREIEVVVVVDGRDDATVAALEALGDRRLRILVPERNLGNAAARNRGVAAARAPWIALLDDDDLWMPQKLALQLAAGERAEAAPDAGPPVVSCRFLARDDEAEFVWPRRRPPPGQPVSDYLFRRRRPSTGDGVVQTSTILAPARLFRECLFDPDCRRFVDVDWLLRAAAHHRARLIFVECDDPLAIWRMEERRRISTQTGWRDDLAWIRARRRLVSRRAYGAFVLTLPSLRAAREGDPRAFPALIAEALARGRPGWAEFVFHLGNFALPPSARARLARLHGRPRNA